jgi:chemotaxis protein MotB
MPTKKFLKAAQELEAQAKLRPVEAPKPQASHDESNWLVSYADMMTLLCGFFVMLFSMANMDQQKYQKAAEAISQQFGGEYHAPADPVDETKKFVTQVLQEQGVDKETTVRTSPSGVALVFHSTLFFDTLSADIKPQGQEVMLKLIQSVKSMQDKSNKKYKIVVEGHTDNRPITAGPFPSNWELSGARASRVVRMFLENGFAADHLTAIGYGETRPEFPSRFPNGTWNEESLAKNRRVVLRILEPHIDSIPYPDTQTATSAH